MKKMVWVLILSVIMIITAAAGCQTGTEEPGTVRIGSLKGPTSMGLAELMERADLQREGF